MESKLIFRDSALTTLDNLVLELKNRKKLSADKDWFLEFRGGLHGFHARIYGISNHFEVMHSWLPKKRGITEHEYHTANLLFNMDSALECFVFMLNALGFAISPSHFHNVSNKDTLRKIKTTDITGLPTKVPPEEPGVEGYRMFFPTVQKIWLRQFELIRRVVDQHDVSKHRKAIFGNGKYQTHAPLGFWRELGFEEEPPNAVNFWPIEEILLHPSPKLPLSKRLQQLERVTLESMTEEFVQLVNNSSAAAYKDVSSWP